MGKVLKSLYGPGLGLIVDGKKGFVRGLGNAATAFFGGPLAVVSSIGSAIFSKSTNAPQASAADRERLVASINPRAPRTMVFGKTAMATDIRDQEFTGTDKEYLHRFIVVASHKINAIESITFDDKAPAWTAAGGVQGEYAGYLTVSVITEGSAANAINISARMGSSRRFTGCAYIHLRYKLTGNTKKTDSPFAQSVPTRMTIVGEGIACYDPRQDSTVAGGSGAHRANNQSTWTYGTHSRNPALQSLTYLLGWKINGLLAVGKGIPANRIDLPSFLTAANACDENVTLAAGGTQPRYRSDGVFNEGDDMSLVLEQFKSTMNAVMDDADGQIRVLVLANDLGSPVATFGMDDIIDDVQWKPVGELSERINIVRGTFTDPSTNALYQSVDYPEVSLASSDGIDRSITVDYPLVQSSAQAQRLAKQRLQRAQYAGIFSCTMQFTAWRVQKNDVVRINFAPLGFVNKLFRVIETGVRVDGTVPMVLREENSAIYLWDANELPSVNAAAPTTYSYTDNPLYQDLGTSFGMADGALAAANAAQTSANAANAKLADIASDSLLTPDEKPSVILDRDVIIAEQSGIESQATAFSITTEKTAYTNAITALTTYLATLTSAVLWSNLSGNTTIVGTTFRTKFSDVYAARQTLLNKIADVAKTRAELGITNAATAQAAAVAAQGVADSAATSASNATTAIANIVNDGILDKSEKPETVQKYNAIIAEQSGIGSRATAFAITTEKTTYDNAVSTLTSYLNGLSPAYNSYTTDTTIVRATFITRFNDVYASRQTLLNKIAEIAGQLATWAQVTGTGKPENYSTKGSNRIFNGDATEGLAGWSKTFFELNTFELSAIAEAIGGEKSFALRKSSAGSGEAVAVSKAIAVIPGQKLFARIKYYGSTTTAAGLYFRIAQLTGNRSEPLYVDSVNISGAVAGSVNADVAEIDLIGNGPVALTLTAFEAPYTVPTGVYWVSLMVLNWTAGPATLIFDDVYLGESQLGADVTATSTPRAEVPPTAVFAATYTGELKTGQAPRYIQNKRFKGSSETTTSSTWSITTSGCTASIGASTGSLEITAVATTGYIDVTSARIGESNITSRISVIKNIDPPPTPPSSSSGTTVSTNSISSTALSTYSGGNTGTLTAKAGSAGTVTLTAPLAYGMAAGGPTSIYAYGKWQMLVSGTWTDVASEIEADGPALRINEGGSFNTYEDGFISVSMTKTGLVNGTNYDFRLQLRKGTGMVTLNFSGTATAAGS